MTDHATFIPGPDTRDQMRRALGRYATGVTVVTVRTPQGNLGMTANSFTSISLDPPLVMWAPACASKRHDAFAEAERYCIHVLSADQMDLAAHFASRGDGFEAFDHEVDADGPPLFAACAARFECTRYAVHPAGDHSIILGQVTRAALTEQQGLVFKLGQYGGFAPRT